MAVVKDAVVMLFVLLVCAQDQVQDPHGWPASPEAQGRVKRAAPESLVLQTQPIPRCSKKATRGQDLPPFFFFFFPPSQQLFFKPTVAASWTSDCVRGIRNVSPAFFFSSCFYFNKKKWVQPLRKMFT